MESYGGLKLICCLQVAFHGLDSAADGGSEVVGGVTVSLLSFFNSFFSCVCWAALFRLACPRALGLFIETQRCLYGDGRAEQAHSAVMKPKFKPGHPPPLSTGSKQLNTIRVWSRVGRSCWFHLDSVSLERIPSSSPHGGESGGKKELMFVFREDSRG